jgi:hypothetical protein
VACPLLFHARHLYVRFHAKAQRAKKQRFLWGKLQRYDHFLFKSVICSFSLSGGKGKLNQTSGFRTTLGNK